MKDDELPCFSATQLAELGHCERKILLVIYAGQQPPPALAKQAGEQRQHAVARPAKWSGILRSTTGARRAMRYIFAPITALRIRLHSPKHARLHLVKPRRSLT